MATLTFKGNAVKNQNHVADGFIYIHHFTTGWQELVFPTHEAARAFAKRINAEFQGPR